MKTLVLILAAAMGRTALAATPTGTPTPAPCIPANPLPSCAGLVCEDWEAYSGSLPAALPGTWMASPVSGGGARIDTTSLGTALVLLPTPGLGCSVVYDGPGALMTDTDIEAEVQIFIPEGRGALFARAQIDGYGLENHQYYFNVIPGEVNGTALGVRNEPGNAHLSEMTYNLPAGCDRIRMRFTVTGTSPVQLRGYINDTLVLSATDPSNTFSYGRAGVDTYSLYTVYDNLRINATSLSPTPSPSFTPSPTQNPSFTLSPTFTPIPSQSASATTTPSPFALSPPPGLGGQEVRAFPNPVKGHNPKVKFAFKLEGAGRVVLRVWNSGGQLAAQVEEKLGAGAGLLSLAVADFAPGIYLYTLTTHLDSGQTRESTVRRFALTPP